MYRCFLLVFLYNIKKEKRKIDHFYARLCTKYIILSLLHWNSFKRMKLSNKQGCAENPPTCQTQLDPTQPAGLGRFLRLGGLGYKIFFYSGSSWVWVIKLQTRQTQPDPPTHPYLKYICKVTNCGPNPKGIGNGLNKSNTINL